MRGGNEAEVVIAFRAENEASAELKDIRNEAREADRGFQGLNRSTIATGLGFLGLGFGAKEVIQNFQEFNRSTGEIQAKLDLLGPAAQDAFKLLEPEFGKIGATVAATELEIAEAFATIIANSGGIAPSAAELAGAFDVARVAGVEFSVAAAAIGQALQGNLEPLQELLDPSGRKSIPSLAAGLVGVKGAARDAITPIDNLATMVRGLGNEISKDVGYSLFIESLVAIGKAAIDTLGPLQKLFDVVVDVLGSEKRLRQVEEQFAAPDVDIANYTSRLGLAPGSGIVGGRGIGEQAQQLVFNINMFGTVDQSIIDRMIRQIESLIRNNNRSGVTITD